MTQSGRRRGRQRMRWLMASLTQWTWVWASSGSWWWTGRPGVLQSTGLQRVGHDWTTELNWSQFNLAWTGSTGSKAMTPSLNHSVAWMFKALISVSRNTVIQCSHTGKIIFKMLSFLIFPPLQSLSSYVPLPQGWPLRTIKLYSIYASRLKHVLEIFFLLRTLAGTGISPACHVTSTFSAKLGTCGVGWSLWMTQLPTLAHHPPWNTEYPLTLILLTASWACIILTFLEGVLSESSWVEPR